MYLSKLQSVFVSIIKCICRVWQKDLRYYMCHHVGLYIPTNQVQISCVWTAKLAASVFLVFPARPHLYFSTQADLYFLQGHICISPHRLIRISRLGCNGHKLAKIWISFPNCQRRLNLQHLQLHL